MITIAETLATHIYSEYCNTQISHLRDAQLATGVR